MVRRQSYKPRKKRTVRAQPRTGEYFNCKFCSEQFYATPSRAAVIKAAGHGYCSGTCAYQDRQKERKICPRCNRKAVRPRRTYCSQACYQEVAQERREAENARPAEAERAL